MQPFTSVLLANTSKLAPESLCHFVSKCTCRTLGWDEPLLAEDHAAPRDSPRCAVDQWHPRPRPAHLFSQSSSSSTTSASSGRRRPLKSLVTKRLQQSHLTNVKLVSVAPSAMLTHRKRREIIAHPSYSIVLMMKPSVGLTVLTSSPMILFTIVVLPALSSPRRRIRISLSFSRALRRIESIVSVDELVCCFFSTASSKMSEVSKASRIKCIDVKETCSIKRMDSKVKTSCHVTLVKSQSTIVGEDRTKCEVGLDAIVVSLCLHATFTAWIRFGSIV